MDRDFFTQVRSATAVALPLATPLDPHIPHADFARAIDSRHAPDLLANPLLVPVQPLASLSLSTPPRFTMRPPASPATRTTALPSSSLAAAANSEFQPIIPQDLADVLQRPGLLLLDIRPNASYSSARVANALSLSVPSTLLKRPAFSLQKLSTMMRASSKAQFLKWSCASFIVVYDADTNSLVDGSNIGGLLRKFRAEGFAGEIGWIRGGFTAVWKEARHLVTEAQLSDSASDGEDDASSLSRAPGHMLLRAQNLPISAFQQSTTTSAARQEHLPSPGSTYSSAAAPPASTRIVAANPFFDNIRQNVELAQGVNERIPLQLPHHVQARVSALPFKWLRDMVSLSGEEQADLLAMQFYKIELGEQRRLQGIMNHHTQNAFQPEAANFPYSISAAIEKGTKNRYRDIYPFEHSRVRLNSATSDGSDYVNASFIQPLGTRRHYIATQGPLPTTYTDFWSLCWEQNVPVIVMLTRQVEGAHVKCGRYWSEERYGPLRLQSISVEGPVEDTERNVSSSFDFGSSNDAAPAEKFSPSTSVIQRKFFLSHDEHPNEPARIITQLQYLGWPDVNVPENPDGLLWMIGAVDRAMAEATAAGQANPGPVLLHCSAGVGRTGGFIVVDAVLDGIRRELRKEATVSQSSTPPSRSRESPDASGSSPSPPEKPSPPIDVPVLSNSAGPGIAPALTRKLFEVSQRTPIRRLQLPPASSSGDSLYRSDSSRSLAHHNGESSSSDSRLFDTPAAFTSSSSLDVSPDDRDVVMSDKPVQRDLGVKTPCASGQQDGFFNGALGSLTPGGSGRPATYFDRPRLEPDASASALESHSTAAFDYAQPRSPDGDVSPRPLTSMDEPVREILEDMRQQRMSLCQTLRQYVFVHRAIIEGALAIVDKESPYADNAGRIKRTSLKRKRRTTPDEDQQERDNSAALLSMRR